MSGTPQRKDREPLTMIPVPQRALPGRRTVPRTWQRAAACALLCAGLWGCDDDGSTFPPTLRFGQVGEVEVDLVVPLAAPLRLAAGSLHQTLIWASTGAWSLHESISYRDVKGEDTFQRNVGDPLPLAAPYASFITLIDGVEGLKLDPEELTQDLDPSCGPTRTRITFTIRDEARGEQRRWIRCAAGSLSNLTPVDAGPDPGAARIVSAAMLARDATVGTDFVSAYNGSVPFGTLARGEDSGAGLTAPFYILDAVSWAAFWLDHSGNTAAPGVDFLTDMVVVAAVGTRDEAGDSVEVRRILQVDDGTLTYIFERVPGDFCSPASRAHVPFHVVVAPRTPEPFRFADIGEERVPCGG